MITKQQLVEMHMASDIKITTEYKLYMIQGGHPLPERTPPAPPPQQPQVAGDING